MVSLLLVAVAFLYPSDSSCGYIHILGEVPAFGISVGDFVLSTDKCQSIWATIDAFGFPTVIRGSLIASCDSSLSTQVSIQQFNDPFCNDSLASNDTHTQLSVGESISMFASALWFTLNDTSCPSVSDHCGVHIEVASQCSKNSSYVGFSLPLSQCETFADDFGFGTPYFHVLKNIPYQMMPAKSVEMMSHSGLKFECCANDHSLLIYNYSEPHCDELSDTAYNLLRLSANYNGQCFVMGATQTPFDANSEKAEASASALDNNDDVFAVRFTWECSAVDAIQCNHIEFMSNEQLPNLCDEGCLVQQDIVLSDNTQSINRTAAAADPNSVFESNPSFYGTLVVVLVVIGLLVLLSVVYFLYRRNKTQGQYEPKAETRGNKEYAAVSSKRELELIDVDQVDMDGDGDTVTQTNEFVLPGRKTHDQDDGADLLMVEKRD